MMVVLFSLVWGWGMVFQLSGFYCRSPKDHLNTRIQHSGSKAQDKADPRNHAL